METRGGPPAIPQLWGGVECTVNRVGDEYFDQLESNGHAMRMDDLDRFAELGFSALRFPLLWERIYPDRIEDADWSWASARLTRLRALRIHPIVGLVHHGSGPRHTCLVDPLFPEKLAQFAQSVARRYPWVVDYVPVNEPLTTARFSGLYGHWFPHGRDDSTFARALIHECRAVVLAMRAIRRVNSAARLLQTEDLGKTFSSPMLRYQADFENERRWLTFDLLCGRVDQHHPIWSFLRQSGIEESELAWFLENPCPPDVIGINYYVTSERFLDEHLEQYPTCSHGGNGRHSYADVEAVRVRASGMAGPAALLDEAWNRYQLPLAITEVHLGCTREEQMRWLLELWDAACSCRRSGIDVRALTVWSLLGTFDWDCLVTRRTGHYEPGVFDVRSPRPRTTALAGMVRELANGRRPQHPVLASPGWWHRPCRLRYPSVVRIPLEAPRSSQIAGRPLLITGATGTLGRAFARICGGRGLSYRLLSRQEMDVADTDSVAAAVAAYDPWAVVNTAGYVRVDDAESEPARCYRENSEGPVVLAEACRRTQTRLVTFSSDLVFDGLSRAPYRESDPAHPLNTYGRSKAAAEVQVLASMPQALVVRTSAFFGPWDEHNFAAAVLHTLAAGHIFEAAEDATISPTYVPDLVHACLDLLEDGETGIWHVANSGAVTWADFARKIARCGHQDESGIRGRPLSAFHWPADRPTYSVLGSERGTLLPSWEDALVRYFRDTSSIRELERSSDRLDGRSNPVVGELIPEAYGCPIG